MAPIPGGGAAGAHGVTRVWSLHCPPAADRGLHPRSAPRSLGLPESAPMPQGTSRARDLGSQGKSSLRGPRRTDVPGGHRGHPPTQRTYVSGVPGLVVRWRAGQEGNIGQEDGQQQQGAHDLPGCPPVEAGPPPGHPGYVVAEPAAEPGLSPHPLGRQPLSTRMWPKGLSPPPL